MRHKRNKRSAFWPDQPCSAGPDLAGGGAPGSRKAPEVPTLTHTQCVNRVREITEEMERLQAVDVLDDKDELYFVELRDEFERVNEHRKRLERSAEIGRIRAAAGEAHVSNLRVLPGTAQQTGATDSGEYDRDAFLEPDSIEAHRFRNPWNLSDVRMFGRSTEDVSGELRSRALSAVEKMPNASDKVRSAATDILERWDDKKGTLARQCLVSSSPEYLRAFSKLAQNQGHLLTDVEKSSVDAVRAMSLTTTAGGYLVPFQLDPTVILTANGSRNDIRERARKVVATGTKWNGVSSGAVSWSWDAEASVVSDDATTFAQPGIDIFKAQGFVPISIEALEDEANVGQVVATLLAEGRDMLESAAFTVGTGTGQPKGVITALVGTGSVVNSAGADVLAVGDLYALQGALPARFRANAAWLANNLFYNRARQFDTAGGSALWAQLGSDRPALLLGRDVLEAEDMDGVINAAAENYMAVFGDFQNYVIADRIGMTVEFIPHLFQQAVAAAGFGRPTGQRGWFAYYRVGADVINPAAFRMLDVT